MLLSLILRSVQQVLQCIGRRRRSFVYGTARCNSVRTEGTLTRRRGRLSGTRTHVARLSALFHGLCRSGTLNELASRQFIFLASNCRSRGGSLTTEVSRLRRRVTAIARQGESVSEFVRVIKGCDSVRRLACRGIRRFVSHVLVRRLSQRAGAQGVRVRCDFIKRISARRRPARIIGRSHHGVMSMGDVTVWPRRGLPLGDHRPRKLVLFRCLLYLLGGWMSKVSSLECYCFRLFSRRRSHRLP